MNNLENMENTGRMSTLEKVVAGTAMGVGSVVTGGLTAVGALGTGYNVYILAKLGEKMNGYEATGILGAAFITSLLTFMAGKGFLYFVRNIPKEIQYMRKR